MCDCYYIKLDCYDKTNLNSWQSLCEVARSTDGQVYVHVSTCTHLSMSNFSLWNKCSY